MEKHILDKADSYPDFVPLDEKEFSKQMEQNVVPFLQKLKKTYTLKTTHGSELYGETFVPRTNGNASYRAVVVLFHGFCEFCAKFDELTYYLLKQNYAVCRFDFSGHGFSSRQIGNTNKVHIRSFQTYVQDAFYAANVLAKPLTRLTQTDNPAQTQKPLPLFLLAHSMGGAVGALFLQQHPHFFNAAALCSPMLDLSLNGIPLWAGKLFIKTLRYTGGAKCYVLGHHAYPVSYTFPERKKATCSENRFMYHYNKRKEDKQLQTWGATFAWLDESLKAIKRIFKKSALASITEPLIVFQAEKDDTVELAGQTFFAEQVPSAKLALCLNANHELYNGTNETLNRWYPELFRFYAAHSG